MPPGATGARSAGFTRISRHAAHPTTGSCPPGNDKTGTTAVVPDSRSRGHTRCTAVTAGNGRYAPEGKGRRPPAPSIGIGAWGPYPWPSTSCGSAARVSSWFQASSRSRGDLWQRTRPPRHRPAPRPGMGCVASAVQTEADSVRVGGALFERQMTRPAQLGRVNPSESGRE